MRYIIFMVSILSIFNSNIANAYENKFDLICKVTKDKVIGLPSDGKKLAPYEIGFETRISYDLVNYEFLGSGESGFIKEVNYNEIIIYNDKNIVTSPEGDNFFKRIWRINLKNGKSTEKFIYFNNSKGSKITGTIETESNCEFAPFTEF